jgi:hypothetical protein
VLADKKGISLSIMITAANTHDMKAATGTLDCIVTKRHHPKTKKNKKTKKKKQKQQQQQQNLCLD